MNIRIDLRCYLSLVLGLSLLLPLTNLTVSAQRPQITMTIGRPNIWSLAQAHYLLANLRQGNRELQPTAPTLNPNSVNGARLDILRTFLGVDAQFSAAQGLQNRVAQAQFETDFGRKQAAIARLDELSKEHLNVVRELTEVNTEIAKLPPAPKANETPDPDVESQRTTLTKTKEAKETLRDALAAQISTATTEAGATVNLSNLSTAAPFGAAAGLPTLRNDLADTKDLIDKMVGSTATPALNASMALDNYINLQYEMIAKQLTLLRDEIGPDERLVFLELPSSLYSVPKVDDDYVVQVKWDVPEYLGNCLRADDEFDANDKGRAVEIQDKPVTQDLIDQYSQFRSNLRLLKSSTRVQQWQLQEQLRLRSDTAIKEKEQKTDKQVSKPTDTDVAQAQAFDQLDQAARDETVSLANRLQKYPQLAEKGWIKTADHKETMHPNGGCQEKAKDRVRVIDVIPRQSALNVNEGYGTQKGWALSAQFLALFGLGGKVSYERQRTHYEQFINQDIFASGFGKGKGSFGWTMGPLPGTKRLAPGPRTTFAILAIPQDAWDIRLSATAIAYPRTKSPDDSHSVKSLTETAQSFDLLVPNENTEGFWVTSINYTPVSAGQRVTAVLRGLYFSPLTGVLVDGVPLKRAVAIAKHESNTTSLPVAADSPGEYEYLNSREIIVSFKAQDATFVGTPLITLVTPEKTGSINYYHDLNINGTKDSLQHYSSIEPMFIGPLSLERLELGKDALAAAAASTIKARLFGTGLRSPAQICIRAGGEQVCLAQTDVQLLSTGSYELTFKKPSEPIWTISYRVGQQSAAVNFDTNVDGLRGSAPSIDSIENPATGKAEGLVNGHYVAIIRGRNLQDVVSVSFGETLVKPEPEKHPNVLFVKVPKGAEGGVRVLLKAKSGETTMTNILDFVTPGRAIFKYVAKPKEDKPPAQKPAQKSGKALHKMERG